MGIVLKELLALDFFKDFQVVAGRKGLNKEIQGVTVQDAPDSFRWSRGRELILTSGYSISMEPDSIRQAFAEGSLQCCCALMVKEGRYFDKIPQNVVDECEAHGFPLIRMPYEVPYMDVMNQVNIAVLNRTIRRFRIESNNVFQFPTLTYKERKIKKILQAVEIEMNFPGFVYDLDEKKSYYSSSNFVRITESFGLRDEDYYNPPSECKEYILCDYIHMKRYRMIHEYESDGSHISWVLIPIIIESEVKAYFVVMESREFLDYFDEYSIRIAFLMLQGVYEQVMVVRSLENTGFENFVLMALNSDEENPKHLFNQAFQQGIAVDATFICTKFHQQNEALTARKERNQFIDIFHHCSLAENGRLAFIDENDGVILTEAKEGHLIDKARLQEGLLEFGEKIAEKCGGMDLKFGVWFQEKPLLEIRKAVQKCSKAIEIGMKIFPQRMVWDYEVLGPLAWLQIPRDEFEQSMQQYGRLLKDEKNRELIKTLKVYLENNMNYSATAEKLYLHINTVRKRIEKIDSLMHIEWDNYIERLKIEIFLQFLVVDDDQVTQRR